MNTHRTDTNRTNTHRTTARILAHAHTHAHTQVLQLLRGDLSSTRGRLLELFCREKKYQAHRKVYQPMKCEAFDGYSRSQVKIEYYCPISKESTVESHSNGFQRTNKCCRPKAEFYYSQYENNKAGYTATPVACGRAGAVIEVTRSFGQEQ